MGRRDGTIAARRRPVSHLFSRSVARHCPRSSAALSRFQKIWPSRNARASRISHNRAHIFGKIWRKRILTLTPIYPPISRHVHRSCLDTYLCFFFLLRPLEGINSMRVRLSKLSHPILISHAPTLCGFDTGNARRRKK